MADEQPIYAIDASFFSPEPKRTPARHGFGSFEVELCDGYAVVYVTDTGAKEAEFIVSTSNDADALVSLAEFLRGFVEFRS